MISFEELAEAGRNYKIDTPHCVKHIKHKYNYIKKYYYVKKNCGKEAWALAHQQ